MRCAGGWWWFDFEAGLGIGLLWHDIITLYALYAREVHMQVQVQIGNSSSHYG